MISQPSPGTVLGLARRRPSLYMAGMDPSVSGYLTDLKTAPAQHIPSGTDLVLIEAFPMPPSVNALYIRRAPDFGGARRGRGLMKSEVYNSYIRDVDQWARQACLVLPRTRVRLHAMLSADTILLEVHAKFYFHREAILTLTGSPKRNDTENRLKALFDQVARVLCIDDKLFWSGGFDKLPVPAKAQERVDIRVMLRRNGF